MIQLTDILKKEFITIDLKTTKKRDILKELVALFGEDIPDAQKKLLLKKLNEREQLGSTGIGQGIAVPHTKSDTVDTLKAAFGISKKGVDFDALDGEPVYVFFLLISPKNEAGAHLKALARISRLLRNSSFCTLIRSVATVDDCYRLLIKEDERV